MGSSKSKITTTIRYAPYIESHHNTFLDLVASYRASLIGDSPYSAYTDIEIEDAFFGAGYAISSFPSLYDMYGKFMAGLDIEALWSQEFEDTVNASVVNDLIAAEAGLMDDDIEANVLPRFQTGMRDINAVMGSSYVIGKAMIEDARVKSIAKFDAELRYKLIPVVQDRWQTHLKWNEQVVQTYVEVMKLYYATAQAINEFNYTMEAKDKLWPFTVLDFERAAIGVLQGATTSKQSGGGSGVGDIISTVVSLVGIAAMFA